MNGKVDLRVIKTHAKLRAALAEMMNTVSFDDITVFDLCERANVRRATFYKHYADKYDFFKDVTTKLIENFSASALQKKDGAVSPVAYYTLFMNEIILYFETRPNILSNLLNSAAFPVMYDIITSCTHSALVNNLTDVNRGGANLKTDVVFTANFINGGIAKIMLDWLKAPTVPKDILLAKINEILAKIFA